MLAALAHTAVRRCARTPDASRLEPDGEQEEHDPDLAERSQPGQLVGREEGGEDARRRRAEERRAEREPRGDLTHRARLPDPTGGRAAEPRGEQDDDELQRQHGAGRRTSGGSTAGSTAAGRAAT
jgi:hypothetical protein